MGPDNRRRQTAPSTHIRRHSILHVPRQTRHNTDAENLRPSPKPLRRHTELQNLPSQHDTGLRTHQNPRHQDTLDIRHNICTSPSILKPKIHKPALHPRRPVVSKRLLERHEIPIIARPHLHVAFPRRHGAKTDKILHHPYARDTTTFTGRSSPLGTFPLVFDAFDTTQNPPIKTDKDILSLLDIFSSLGFSVPSTGAVTSLTAVKTSILFKRTRYDPLQGTPVSGLPHQPTLLEQFTNFVDKLFHKTAVPDNPLHRIQKVYVDGTPYIIETLAIPLTDFTKLIPQIPPSFVTLVAERARHTQQDTDS